MTSLAKQHARHRAHQRASQRRRKAQLAILAAIILVALAIVGLLIALSRPTPDTPPSYSYDGLGQEIDQTGAVGLALGDKSAPVTLTEYSDFSCPHCHEIIPTIQLLH